MIWFAVKTLLGAALKLLLAVAIIFFALELASRAAPGPASANVRFWHWLGMLSLGDFGQSGTPAVAIRGLILQRLSVTLPLVLLAYMLVAILGVGLGYPAGRSAGFGDRAAMGFARLLTIVPALWLALLLILVFAALLHWLPAGGFVVWTSNVGLSLLSLLLPALALALPSAGMVAIVLRDAMKEATAAPYFRASLARGLSDEQAFRRHALPNIMACVLDRAGPALLLILPVSILVESVFYLPGLGRLLLDAVAAHDVPMVEAGLVIVILGLLLVGVVLRIGRGLVDKRLWRGAPT